jgi:glycosyltransferase involved in cell wall biosynthesis
VLHAFLFYSYVLGAPAARLARVPMLVAGRRSLGDFKQGRPLWQLMERVATRATDLLIANAEAVAEDTRQREKVPYDKIAVVYNGLPESAFEPVPPVTLDARSPVVLCVANFWRYKGHRFLIEAAARLRDNGIPCTLVLVGQQPPTEPSERTALGDLAERLGVDARFLGPRTDVERLLARADVFALPSLTEGMSNSIMEAMAAGRPVVATDVGGTRELLDGCGVLVPPADSDALAAGLAKVLTDPELAARLGRDARTWSRSHLHVDTMVDRHIHIYNGLLRPQRQPR